MTLSVLIKKGGLTGKMTATPATVATLQADKPVTVAQVATVAVAAPPEPLPGLSLEDEGNIRAWLAHIQETDQNILAEVVDKCRNDLEARRYIMKQSKEIPVAVTVNHPMTCGDCIHFQRTYHPNLGHCPKDEPEPIAGLWDTDRRFCARFFSKPQQTHRVHTRPAKAETKE